MASVPVSNVSDTARWVAYYRALESKRPDALFHDRWAEELAGQQGAAIVEHLPKGQALAWPIIVRTAVIDELLLQAIERDGVDTVLNLAAGLDTRAYRLSFPRPVRWIDADLPDILAHRDSILAGETPACQHESVQVDLTDPAARQSLFNRVGASDNHVLVIAEGLLIYLQPGDVASLARHLYDQPSFAYWLIDLASPQLLERLSRTWGRTLAESKAPFRFAPWDGTAFFEPHGWRELEFRPTFDEAIRLRRAMRFAKFWQMLMQLAPAKRREAFRRMSGVVLLAREKRKL